MLATEATLIQRAKRGDQNALVELYETYHPPVFTYVFYRLNDQSLAEDLTSEVFVRMVENLAGYQIKDRPILAWLYTIARNLILDHARLAANRNGHLPLEEARIASEHDQTHQLAEQNLARDALRQILQKLTEEQRLVIFLKFFHNYSNDEIGQVLGKTEGAVKSLQHRALASIHRLINEGNYEPEF